MTDQPNPAQVTSFDHHRLADLPEYNRVGKALNDLLTAINRAEIEISQPEWLDAVRNLTAALPFADGCDECPPVSITVPARTEIDTDGWLTGYYKCTEHGRQWTSGWALDAPTWF
ncbi:hypothetical protein [Streptosporangium roseum]|uniref:Uncharacterized protein n=1 Tax=Streptosporangium roseum (strain ATCC 12428 / DSM 43021 / JCM 3005 / KCTC 9067 / NCIMB 10171 / NRRL 2505 / NI 9100) TaxID=479432 RepID=D2BFX0_STRRD|nr:hypothetical protein [Streptosporangium roseum]ACZ92022.1 hypothetical protein Sros_9404 [Streptosporangium roseum DSM 43021]